MTQALKTTTIIGFAAVLVGGAALFTARVPTATARPGDSGFGLEARLASSNVFRGTSETEMAITIRAPVPPSESRRPAASIAVVIDRSGSMAGAKLTHAKAAARQLVESLRSDDRIAIIAYGSDVTVVVPSQHATDSARALAVDAIDRIHNEGGTNLSGGLAAGSQQLATKARIEGVTRLVLISDGLANEGIVDRGELAMLARRTAAEGISVTTVGVGLDFDERTMTEVAVSGRGNYYFVESSEALAEMFVAELDALSKTAATEVRLALRPAPGVDVLEAFGYPLERGSDAVYIPVADLRAGEERKVVVRLRIDAPRLGAMAIADVDLGFRARDASDRTSMRAVTRAAVTANRQEVIRGRDREALSLIERARTGQAINEATLLWESGDSEGAAQIIEERRQQSAALAADTGGMDDMLIDVEKAATKAKHGFAAAGRPASSDGKRARKDGRKDAYELMH